MDTLRALIVDDERLSRLALRQLLNAAGDVVVVGECRDAIEAETRLADVDVVFLDIQMPQRSGLEAAHTWGVGRGAPCIVFVTAFDEFALSAYETEAVDYLPKPVAPSRLAKSLTRVRERLRSARALVGTTDAPASLTRLVTRVRGSDVIIPLEQIQCLEADGVYVAVWVGPRRLLVRHSLDALESELPADAFIRVHRSWIVAVGRVTAMRRNRRDGGRELVLDTGRVIPVSRRRQQQVARRLFRGSADMRR